MIVLQLYLMLVVTITGTAISCAPHSHELRRVKRMDETENATFTFNCSRRAIGFYADVAYHCQIFHMCDAKGNRIPHVCAKDTSFNQEYRICDWEFNFNCSEAPRWYFLNELPYLHV